MGQALRNPGYYSVEEYLALEQSLGERCEYVDGVIYSMTGGSDRHNLIAGNAFFALRRDLPDDCEVYSQGMKSRVQTDTDEARYYPDVMVCCDHSDRDPLYRERPCVIIEVLSPSTETNDRQGKFANYRKMPSLGHYVLVAQDVPQVEVFARDADWRPAMLFKGDRITVCDGRATLSVDDIYARISFSNLKPGDFG